MDNSADDRLDDFDLSFKVYYEMMARRVSEILLVSSPYDAFIMEEDGRLAERIIHEYRGLNLTRPPRLTWVSNAREAMDALSRRKFDLVLTMPRIHDMDPYELGQAVKARFQNLPVFLLTHHTADLRRLDAGGDRAGIDRIYVWLGNTDLLLAMIKSVEDRMNAPYDTHRARVRVIILVEDSPAYRSSLLPLLYREVVTQTNAVMEESLNEEHRILRMRARPKILIAETYEEAWELYQEYKPYLLSVFSDVRFPRNGAEDPTAGYQLLSAIRAEDPDIPLLMLSSEPENRERSETIPAIFLNKNAPALHDDISGFLVNYLGFGDFVFRMPDGTEVARASNLREMETILPEIPDESVEYHAVRNHFSSWLMARSEVQLASRLRPIKASDFESVQAIKDFLVSRFRERRKGRQRGVVADFSPEGFDPDTDFMKIGKGSLGGKARGLAFMTTLLKQSPELMEKFPEVSISVPKTLVISTEGFDDVMRENDLRELIACTCDDSEVLSLFSRARLPGRLRHDLESFLAQVTVPLAIRSSSLLEDAQYQARAGIYSTFMIPNNHPDPEVRLHQLSQAIMLVYASTYSEQSRTFSRSTLQRTEEEKMAVIIQQLTGMAYGNYFYPAISGVAQSYNFYPLAQMRPEDGIIHLAFGLGKTVVEGGTALRFSPAYPTFMPQFSTVEDILKNAQREFYALSMSDFPDSITGPTDAALTRLSIDDPAVSSHYPVKYLSSTYSPEDHRIRDTGFGPGHKVLTFASILKYKTIPLPGIIREILQMGRKGMGCAVEIEFAVNIPADRSERPAFSLLQIRPMAMTRRNMEVRIEESERSAAVLYSTSALGNGVYEDIEDVLYVRRDTFNPGRTVEQAGQIAEMNRELAEAGRKYLLIGPGRWGTADRWLGIPVSWGDISGVGAMVEVSLESLKADPSQGSHFFNNITSLGISYLTVTDRGEDFLQWDWLERQPVTRETEYFRHARLSRPLTLKIDGKRSRAVVLP